MQHKDQEQRTIVEQRRYFKLPAVCSFLGQKQSNKVKVVVIIGKPVRAMQFGNKQIHHKHKDMNINVIVEDEQSKSTTLTPNHNCECERECERECEHKMSHCDRNDEWASS